jgi:integrative and conjugative element protein (TIGR02256 family)
MTYVALPGFEPVPLERSALQLSRAVEIFDAISKSRSCDLLELHRSVAGTEAGELLVVDITNDEVPTRNSPGIHYVERIGIVVRTNGLSVPEVYPLRDGFPSVPHRNSPRLAFPPDLCLYFQPPRAVLRTWTAPKFIARIQWWLQATASGTLHAADQPAEGLFFMTRQELVLPFDFKERRDAGDILYIGKGVVRPDGGSTCFGCFQSKSAATPATKSGLVDIDLPPVLNETVTDSPATLGMLHDRLAKEGYSLRDALIKAVTGQVPSEGCDVCSSTNFTMLLLNVPLLAGDLTSIDRVDHRVFFIDSDIFRLGEMLGCIFKLENRFHKVATIGDDSSSTTDWRTLSLEMVDVLFQNDRASARRQSGISDEGPKGVLIGAGSLGSAMYDIWTRSSWGQWTVVDKDHIKPHNIVRHISTFDQVGVPKAHAAIEHANAIAIGGTQSKSMVVDAIETQEEVFHVANCNADLVVDASTTLDYPRRAAVTANWARHASVFITPSGRDGILLLENTARTCTLVSLEAQYYRAVICSDWGSHHLDWNLGTFWSGAGCRDISLALPYSRVLVHAATQSEQLMLLAKADSAAIRVWMRDTDSGSVTTYTVPTAAEIRYDLDTSTAYSDAALIDKLHQLRKVALPKETGGVLLGYWDNNINALVLVDALAAPSDSVSDVDSFVRGTNGLAEAVSEANRRTAGVVGYVGEWHSHPPGVQATPSTDDLMQIAALATRMADDGLPVVSLIVGEDDIRLMQGRAA